MDAVNKRELCTVPAEDLIVESVVIMVGAIVGEASVVWAAFGIAPSYLLCPEPSAGFASLNPKPVFPVAVVPTIASLTTLADALPVTT
jgi:hypothetical protein